MMRKLISLFVVFISTNAFALSSDYIEEGYRYGLSDFKYSPAEFTLAVPSGCSLVSCSEAPSVISKLGTKVDFAYCNYGVYSPLLGETCTISGDTVRCGSSYLPVSSKFYLLLKCPIAVDSSSGTSISLDGYACFDDSGEGTEAKMCINTDDGSGWLCPIDMVKCDDKIVYECDAGYTYNSISRKCERAADVSYLCPSGMTYNSATGKCEIPAVVDTSGDEGIKCESWDHKYAECTPSLIGYISSVSVTEKLSTAGCTLDESYGITSDRKKIWVDDGCRAKFSVSGTYKACPDGYSLAYTSTGTLCYICPAGSYFDSSTRKCLAGATPDYYCPAGGTLSGTTCLKDPIEKTVYTCPYGDSYPCVPSSGQMYCSKTACLDVSTDENGTVSIEDSAVIGNSTVNATVENDTAVPEGANDKEADGTVNSDGMCTGWLYVFNGKDYRCRPPGTQTGWANCCSGGLMWLGLLNCNNREKELGIMKNDGKCHEIGSYCITKVLGVCLQKKKTYCCFSSKFARIVQEQGRRQLGISWGTAESPNCRGFTIDEFQKLDFSKMDFSEVYGDMQDRAEDAINRFKAITPTVP